MEKRRNLDSIKRVSRTKQAALPVKKRPVGVKFDSVVKREIKKSVLLARTHCTPVFVVPRKIQAAKSKNFVIWQRLYREQKVPVLVAVVALIFAFGAGTWAALNTTKSVAETQSQPAILGETTSQSLSPDPNQGAVVGGNQLQNPSDVNVSSQILFNTPIQYLQSYFASMNEPDVINKRQVQLVEFLKNKKSPLAEAASTIATQEHWKLILAIAFAESTLGKNCADFNCSNIGIKPGSPIWRQYGSYNAWVVDFNRLLDKRYKDWTLEQMCGVYVKPCNQNWLLATQQILDELKQQEIE